MKIITSIPAHDLQAVGDAARNVERRGYDGISTQENRHNPFLPLAVAATTTSTLELRTSVAIAFARSPMVAANLGWDLQQASNGRFVLGLGSQVKGHNVRRFSVPWSPPAPRMREYVRAIRSIWNCWQTGDALDYSGEHYQFSLMTPNFTPEPLNCRLPAIHIAAVGPAMMRLAGAECDGVMLHPFCTRKYLDNVVMPILDDALANAERTREHFEISGGGFIASGADDAAVEKMTQWVRMRIGFYGSTPSYWPVFAQHGLEDLGHKLIEMSKKGQWDAMTQEISDDVLRLFCAVGRHDEIAAAIETRFGGVADVIAADENLPADLLADIRRIGR